MTGNVHLHQFSAAGFRSLSSVRDIPVSSPTILAGHNDGGKSAALTALRFLVGDYKFAEDDRTYELPAAGAADGSVLTRCETTYVEGFFVLDAWECENFDLPRELRIRRYADEDPAGRVMYWAPLPDDERLRDLGQFTAAELKVISRELRLAPASTRRADLEAALRSYGEANASSMGWTRLPGELTRRMPRVLPFDGRTAKPDQAVRAALKGRFESHVADDRLRGRLQEMEGEVKERLRDDAKSLCAHIRSRCPDLTDVRVEPDVAFDYGFRGAPLKIARTSGESVGLDRSGQGSSRRISLAIWEWTCELLEDENAASRKSAVADDGPPPVQTIVLYDEPDTHLDYGHQRTIMRLIRDQAALPNVNVMVATHSMNLIDGVDISDVVHLRLEHGRTVMERLGSDRHESIDMHLEQIAASLGLRNSVLLHERCFLAVEGETEQQAMPILFRLSQGMSLQAAGIALWACFNNEGALHLARYLVQHGRSVMLMVDADSRNVKKSLFKHDRLIKLLGGGDEVSRMVRLVGEPDGYMELEELFSDDLWAMVSNEVWPKEEKWLCSDFAALRDGRKFSDGVLEMIRNGCADGPSGNRR